MPRLLLALLLALPALAQSPQQLFESRCAGCHGADANGGGHGKAIGLRDQTVIRDIILKGIPAAGMPAFDIPGSEASLIAAFLSGLRPPAATASTGDPAAGQRLYADRDCAACHMIRGRGE